MICPTTFEVSEVYKLNMDRFPSLENVQGPAIVRCICAESYREKCNAIDFSREEGAERKYCIGRCDCRAVIQYLDLPKFFSRYRDLKGKWHKF